MLCYITVDVFRALVQRLTPCVCFWFPKSHVVNLLTPNDPYMGRTAPLTSKRCILYIYSTNKGTECFKHALYSPFFFSSKCSLLHNANLFDSCIIHILYTGCAKIKKIFPAPKGLIYEVYNQLYVHQNVYTSGFNKSTCFGMS